MSAIPPVNANAQTEIELNDSCNCCFPRKIKRSNASRNLTPESDKTNKLIKDLMTPIRDSTEVYNLDIHIHKERRHSNDKKNSMGDPVKDVKAQKKHKSKGKK